MLAFLELGDSDASCIVGRRGLSTVVGSTIGGFSRSFVTGGVDLVCRPYRGAMVASRG